MQFEPKEDEVYFCEDEGYGIVYSHEKKSLYKISSEQAKKLKEIKKRQSIIKSDSREIVNFDNSNLKKIELIMSTACNLKCDYCFANGGNYNLKIRNIKIDVLDKTIELIEKSKNVNEIVFFGGEPTLAEKEIEYLCENLRRKGLFPKYKIVTNLYQLSNQLIDIIYKYNIIITISLDGPEWINNKRRKARDGGNVYQRVVNNVERLNNKGINIKAIEATYMTTHKEAGFSKEELKDFFKDNFKIDDIYIVDELNEKENEVESEIGNLFQKNNLESCDLLFLSSYFQENKKLYGICNSGISSICIDPQGYIYPCHLYINKNYSLGNILNGKIKSFKEINWIREKLGCYNCSARYSCNICLAHCLISNTSLEDKCMKVKKENSKLVYKMFRYLDTHNLQNLNKGENNGRDQIRSFE